MPIGGDALITAIQATLIEDGTIMDNVTEHHRSPCYPASLQFLNRRSHKVGEGGRTHICVSISALILVAFASDRFQCEIDRRVSSKPISGSPISSDHNRHTIL